jgi:hypothetical protein
MPSTPVPGTELGPVVVCTTLGYPAYCFFVFVFWSSYNIHIHTHTHTRLPLLPLVDPRQRPEPLVKHTWGPPANGKALPTTCRGKQRTQVPGTKGRRHRNPHTSNIMYFIVDSIPSLHDVVARPGIHA